MSDLISRQAAIDALGERPLVWDEHTDEYELGQRNQYDSDRAAIEALPPALRWIPVTERLPDEDASVLASIKNHSFEVAVGEIDGEVFWIVDGFIPLDAVMAWMPLPEPWKGEKGDADD